MGGYHYSREGFSVECTAPASLLSCPEPLLLRRMPCPQLLVIALLDKVGPSPRMTYSGHLLPLHQVTSLF